MNWYVYLNEEAKEIPEDILIYKIQNNEISSDTLVVNEKIEKWIPLKETEIFKRNCIINEGSVDIKVANINTETQDAESENQKKRSRNMNIKTGISVATFIFALLNIVNTMFICQTMDMKSLEHINEIMLAVGALLGIVALIISLFNLSADNFEIKKDFRTQNYAIWRYMHTGRKLAIAAIILLCLEFAYFIVSLNGVFECSFFSEDFIRNLGNSPQNYY